MQHETDARKFWLIILINNLLSQVIPILASCTSCSRSIPLWKWSSFPYLLVMLILSSPNIFKKRYAMHISENLKILQPSSWAESVFTESFDCSTTGHHREKTFTGCTITRTWNSETLSPISTLRLFPASATLDINMYLGSSGRSTTTSSGGSCCSIGSCGNCGAVHEVYPKEQEITESEIPEGLLRMCRRYSEMGGMLEKHVSRTLSSDNWVMQLIMGDSVPQHSYPEICCAANNYVNLRW